MTDDALRRALADLRAGDREAFPAIYDALSTPVYTVLLRFTGDRCAAEDLLQETFLRLYRTPPGSEVASPRAWVFKVARNLAVDHLRARRENLPLDDAAPAPCPDPDTRLDVADALARLTAEDRLLVTLRLNGGLKFREAAELLDLPLGTALRRYHAAIGLVRDYLNG